MKSSTRPFQRPIRDRTRIEIAPMSMIVLWLILGRSPIDIHILFNTLHLKHIIEKDTQVDRSFSDSPSENIREFFDNKDK